MKRGNNWRGGLSVRKDGYRSHWMPDHPNASGSGHVLEHVLVASRALGHALPKGAVIHHVNEDPSDNRPQNLVVCEDQAYHMLIHQRQRALDECGNANWRKCGICKAYDDPFNLRIPDAIGKQPYHLACSAEKAREYRKRRKAAA